MGQPVFAFVFTDASQFVPIGTGSGLCTPGMVMFSDGGGEVTFSGTQAPGSPLSLPPPPGGEKVPKQSVLLMVSDTVTITVAKDKAPSFRFAVCDGNGVYQAYALAGIALQNTSRSGNGVAQFPKTSIEVDQSATILQLNDDNKDDCTYEFYVLVQNAAGQLGLIDPRIVNQS
jgi:hypothetical protein